MRKGFTRFCHCGERATRQSRSVEKIPICRVSGWLDAFATFSVFFSPKVKKPQEARDKGFSKSEVGWPRSSPEFLRNWTAESKPDKSDLFNRARQSRQFGFTLIEFTMVLILVALIATITLSSLTDSTNYTRFEETRKKLEALKIAILGDASVEDLASRGRFGYMGDIGNLPVTLDSLISRGSQPVYTLNTYFGIGYGWRGPYFAEPFGNSLAIGKDAWGNDLSYDTGASPPYIKSLGADNAANGVLYNKDIEVTLPDAQRLSSVFGVVADEAIRVGTANVELRYPEQGVLATYVSASAISGYFVFDTVPFGVRSIRVNGPAPLPSLPPQRLIIDQPKTIAAEHTTNLFRKSNIDSPSPALSVGNTTLTLTVTSRYPFTVTLDHLILLHTTSHTLSSVKFNGAAAEALPNIDSGVKVKPIATQTVTAGDNTIVFVFSGDVSSASFFLTLVWTLPGRKDTVKFST